MHGKAHRTTIESGLHTEVGDEVDARETGCVRGSGVAAGAGGVRCALGGGGRGMGAGGTWISER